MKELNHRVKNSLLMTISLIKLKDSETESDLSDIQKQIEAISLIHEKLYQSESVSAINCRDYLGDLLSSVFSSFTSREVKIDKSIEDVMLPTKTAMPIGLIVNEIATNTIKYGYPEKDEPVFSISLKMDKEKQIYELVIANNGKPFPKDVDAESTETLGLRLINALVKQIDGTLRLQKKPHPVFTIQFDLNILR